MNHLKTLFDWPPVWLLAGLVLVWGSDRVVTLQNFSRLGAAMVLAGLALMGWAAAQMVLARTTVNPRGQPAALVTGGVFAISRNPIYLGDALVYIVAPDRYLSAIDALSGKTLWRSNDATVRESIGISADGNLIYGKTVQDTIVAYKTGFEKQSATWKLHAGFGYEHVPSMLIENEGLVFFGTKSGAVYCMNPTERKIVWMHKIDNSMVNTVRVISKNKLVVSTMDGKLVFLDISGT